MDAYINEAINKNALTVLLEISKFPYIKRKATIIHKIKRGNKPLSFYSRASCFRSTPSRSSRSTSRKVHTSAYTAMQLGASFVRAASTSERT